MASIDVTFEGPITDPNLADKLVGRAMDYLAQALSRSMPSLRRGVPYRTGNLQRSLKIAYSRRGRIVRIGFTAQGYYWKYQSGLARDLNRIFFTTIRSNQQNAFNKASADVLP